MFFVCLLGCLHRLIRKMSSQPNTRDNKIKRTDNYLSLTKMGGGPRVVVNTAAFHARVRGSVPGLFERNKNVSSPSTCESQYCGESP